MKRKDKGRRKEKANSAKRVDGSRTTRGKKIFLRNKNR